MTRTEAEVKAILDAVNHALKAEHIPPARARRVMNRLTHGHPDGQQARQQLDLALTAIGTTLRRHNHGDNNP